MHLILRWQEIEFHSPGPPGLTVNLPSWVERAEWAGYLRANVTVQCPRQQGGEQTPEHRMMEVLQKKKLKASIKQNGEMLIETANAARENNNDK